MRFLVDDQLPFRLSRCLDREPWDRAAGEHRVVVQKDALLHAFDSVLEAVIAAIDAGQRIVELR